MKTSTSSKNISTSSTSVSASSITKEIPVTKLYAYTFVYSIAPFNDLRTYTTCDKDYITAYEQFRQGFNWLEGFTIYPNAKIPVKNIEGITRLV